MQGLDDKFKSIAEQLRMEVKEAIVSFNKDDLKYFPNCVKKIIADLEGGSPSHTERYFLASFLFKINMPFEEVLGIFSKANNYDEKIAKYQLKKIQEGKYSVANCSKLKSLGIDCEDCNSSSSISYYLYYKKKNKKYKNYRKENNAEKTNIKTTG